MIRIERKGTQNLNREACVAVSHKSHPVTQRKKIDYRRMC